MRVKWEKRSRYDFVAHIGDDELHAWLGPPGRTWNANATCNGGDIYAITFTPPSERAAKREAVRMWRALRGSK